METRLSEADIAFQQEVRAFLNEAWDKDLEAKVNNRSTMKEGVEEWQKRLYRKGWMAPHWPLEHGGIDWSVTQKFIYNSERAAAGAPETVAFGVTMVASVILAVGNRRLRVVLRPVPVCLPGASTREHDLVAPSCKSVCLCVLRLQLHRPLQ